MFDNFSSFSFHQTKIINHPPPEKFKFTINRDSKWEIGENYKKVHNTEGKEQRIEHITHFP